MKSLTLYKYSITLSLISFNCVKYWTIVLAKIENPIDKEMIIITVLYRIKICCIILYIAFLNKSDKLHCANITIVILIAQHLIHVTKTVTWPFLLNKIP